MRRAILAAAAATLLLAAVWVLVRPNRPAVSGGAGSPKAVVVAPKPPTTSPVSPIEALLTESSVSVPVEVGLDVVKRALEKAVPARFDQTIPIGSFGPAKDVRAVLDLTRGEITLTPQGDRVAFRFPLGGKIPVKAQIDPGPGGGWGAQETIEDVSATVSGWVKIGLDRNWEFSHESDAKLEIDKADVKFPLGVKVSVRDTLEKHAKDEIPKVLRRVLADAGSKLQVRARAEEGWSKLHLAQAVHESPKVTVTVQPTAVRASPVRFDADGVARAALAVSARTATYVSADAPPPQRSALPELVTDARLDGRLHLVLPVSVPVSTLVPSMRAALVNKPVAAPGGIDFKPTGVNLWLVNETAHLQVEFEATKQATPPLAANGTLHALGKVTYDRGEQVLRVRDVAYDVETRNVLLSQAAWLMEPTILNELQKAASFPLAGELAKAKDAINAQVAKVNTPPGIRLDLSVADIKLRDVRPASDVVYLLFDVTGNAQAKVTPAATPP